jgi:anthraniloyl-CoA monooxygenase
VHLGARAMGGAALGVPRDDLRLARCPHHARLPRPVERRAAAEGLRRIVDFVHRETPAKIGIQLGHAGRKGATKLAWEGIDQPLERWAAGR